MKHHSAAYRLSQLYNYIYCKQCQIFENVDNRPKIVCFVSAALLPRRATASCYRIFSKIQNVKKA